MAKYSPELVQEVEEWVSENGLIQHGGATLKDFLKHFNIENGTYYRWLKLDEFNEALSRARERYKSTCEQEVVPSLLRLIKGHTTTTKITEYIDDEKNKNKPKVKKMTIREIEHEPNLGAIQYFLNNICSERWSNTQNIKADVKGEGLKIIVADSEEAKLLEQLNNALTQAEEPVAQEIQN